ncbi:hypothetical protein Tco_0240067, partial [Tanacetum coccineum]
MTPYTGYPDVQGIIYQDKLSRNWLMHTNELYKFSYGTLNHKAQRSKVDAQLGEVCRRKTVRGVGNKSSYDLILPTVLKELVLPAQ